MRDRRQGLTDDDFDRLKAERDASLQAEVAAFCAKHGWDAKEVHVHASGAGGCYCACPEGPCQHEFEGWREFEDGNGGSTVCKHCGLDSFSHDIRIMP